eukprot:10409912-Alexandrium_andersonii.AAC.1
MSASLVGSEMCIRDRLVSACTTAATSSTLHAFALGAPGVAAGVADVLELVALPPERMWLQKVRNSNAGCTGPPAQEP